MKSRVLMLLTVSARGFGQVTVGQAPAAPPAQARGGRGVQDTLVSPEVHPDRTVTFRVRAGAHVLPVRRWALSEFAPLLFKKGSV